MLRVPMLSRFFLLTVFALLLPCSSLAAEVPVNFSREILPLLSENCLSCHGPDEAERKADLRLDTREGALAALVPGAPEKSLLLERVRTRDADEIMPPPKSHKPPLSAEQAALLERWIREGAVWGRHWAFEKPVRPVLPEGSADQELHHPLDRLLAARLAKEGLRMAPRAAAHTLARRLSYGLTGLPPADGAADLPLTLLVDRLLASPHYGERMAMWWLDAARYSDTDGFQADATRTNWPWRDWVVGAFNANMPFDEFTRLQFAGDLLPEATAEQKLATCFHRNHMTNGEGGRDPEESRVDYVLDRVNTTGALWLGLTLGCAQCHTHKFDPVTHADYYKMTAFFNSIDEDGKAGSGAKPYLSYQSPLAAGSVAEARALLELRRPAVQAASEGAETAFQKWLVDHAARVAGGFSAWQVLRGRVESVEGTWLQQDEEGIVRASGPNPRQDDYRLTGRVGLKRVTGFRLEVLPDAAHTGGGLSRGESGEFILTNVKAQVMMPGSSQVRELTLAGAVADVSLDTKGKREYGNVRDTLDDDPRNGWSTAGADTTQPHVAVFAFKEPWLPEPEEELVIELKQRSTLGDASLGKFRVSLTDQPGQPVRSLERMPLEELAAMSGRVDRLSEPLRGRLREQFLEDHAPYQQAKAALERAEAQWRESTAATAALNVMVLAERKEPRATHVLLRGEWDKHGEKVPPGVPETLAAWPADLSANRLGLAEWIVSPENPLTARVIVNHLWQMLFGTGLVRTPGDFGLQGERPVYPELLDWLAVEFVESGWDVKHVLRQIVSSELYQQDSGAERALLERDPSNLLLARAPRFRHPSWMLRDAALHMAGLLNPALGGPPVRPPQPPGVWEENFMGRFTYVPSEGGARHRRTLYAFWRRSSAPTFLFDNAQRRVCEVAVMRTNTPLQALTLLNDLSYLEAARALASSVHELTGGPERHLRALHERVLTRQPSEVELSILMREHERALGHYQAQPAEAAAFLEEPSSAHSQQPARAALALVASLLLNLDEALTQE